MTDTRRRRRFLTGAAAVCASTLFPHARASAAERPPETTRIRLLRGPAICHTPQFIAEDFLRAEGFRDVRYVEQEQVRGASAIAQGIADIASWDAFSTLPVLDAGGQIVVLAGVHAGCWELFVNGPIHTLTDLKGRTVAIRDFANGDYVLLSSMLAYVGLDPRTAVKWVKGPSVTDGIELFRAGKADAYMAFSPQPEELRAQNVGRVLIDTAQDRPWSQYFCCVFVARREFVSSNPVATKRALRALLKATDLCAQAPERAARMLADRGFGPRYDISLKVLRKLPYDRWRHANPEDTLRFYALRLHEVGMLKANPEKLIAQGTDWRFLNELKKELKA
jgi:NitT/TauT family transport system substrate-binding protein